MPAIHVAISVFAFIELPVFFLDVRTNLSLFGFFWEQLLVYNFGNTGLEAKSFFS